MRAAVLCLLALVACGAVLARANDVSADESEVMEENMSADDYDALPFAPQQSEHDEVADDTADEAVEESEVSDEASDAADALEGNTEFDGAFLQLDAEAEEDTAKPTSKKVRVKVLPKRVRVQKVRAPKPLDVIKFHPERVRADSTKPTDPELEKLDLALAAVKEDILSTNKQITDERKWVIAVAKIIAAYNGKMKRVEAHIIALRKEMKSLYRKKKQIENLKLQRALEAKLKEAKAELATLISSLKHVAVKRSDLLRSGADLRNTIAGISAQLRKLRGQTPASTKRNRSRRGGKKARRNGKGKGKKRAAKRM